MPETGNSWEGEGVIQNAQNLFPQKHGKGKSPIIIHKGTNLRNFIAA